MIYHSSAVAEVLKSLASTPQGLSGEEVKSRQEKYGSNQLEQGETISIWSIIWDQFNSFLTLLLVIAAVFSFLIGEKLDSIVILLVLLLNGVVGFIQEYKAEEAIAQLKKIQTYSSEVRRNGELVEIPAEELVPGDIVILSEGQRIPADGRLIKINDLEVDESILTGESKPVSKKIEVIDEKAQVAERLNSVFSGTIVTRGKAEMVVTAIGMETEFGKIAELVQNTTQSNTPLQLTLEKLGRVLGLISVGIAAPALVAGLLMNREWTEILLTAIALAVSAIPEGLPIVVTIVLAFGVKRMIKKHVLIRRLSAVEALGSTEIICTDKTGTLTQNKMEVTHLFSLEKKDQLLSDVLKKKSTQYQDLAEVALFCNDATPSFGDPTEQALIVLAEKVGVKFEQREKKERVKEIPFNSKDKFMAVLYELAGKNRAMVKGAPEKVIEMCQLNKKELTEIKRQVEEYTAQGMRVLALASKQASSLQKLEKYQFLGLVGMIDPPRPSVKPALKSCERAGIRVIMITGDHPLTAAAIAKEVGIKSPEVVTGKDLDSLTPGELANTVKTTNIFARVSPQHKLDILQALQKQDHFVAMTGDGVNDAPALKEANIGIAVGAGSDLAKEVADMVILNNDFASIVAAIKEGRGIFSNIKKVVTFLIAVNFDEILITMASILLSLPLPLLPIHLLWLNLVTDTFPALALSVDPYDNNVMKEPPYDPQREIVHGVFTFSLVAALFAFTSSFAVFIMDLFVFNSTVAHAQTLTFTVTVLFELLFVFVVRSHKRFKESKPFANKWLLLAVYAGFVAQMFAVYFPWSHHIFKTVPLNLTEWAMLVPFSLLGIVGFEVLKIFGLTFFEGPVYTKADHEK